MPKEIFHQYLILIHSSYPNTLAPVSSERRLRAVFLDAMEHPAHVVLLLEHGAGCGAERQRTVRDGRAAVSACQLAGDASAAA